MKIQQQELLKILSSYDDQAKISQTQVHEKKKIIYNKQINLTTRVDNWRNQIFSFKPLNVLFLNSLFLNDNPKFKQIRTLFNKYNQQISNIEADINTDTIDHLRPKIMESMLRYMRIVMLTQDRQAQLRLLKLGYEWFIDKLDPAQKYDSNKDYTKQLDQRLQKIRQMDLKKVSNINSNLPSQQIKVEQYDYIRDYRTKYSDLQTAKDRVSQYKRRILNFQDPEKLKKPIPQVKNRVKYDKPVLLYMKSKTEKQQIPPDNIQVAVALDSQSPPGIQPLIQAIISDPNKPPGQGEGQNVADVGQEQFQQPQLGDEPGQGQEQPLQIEEVKQGKLNPKTKNYIYPQEYHDQKVFLRMEQRFLKNYEHQQRNIVEDQAKVDQIKQWAVKKARMQSQNMRKLQSIRQMARMRTSSRQPFNNRTEKLNTQPDRTVNFVQEQNQKKQFVQFQQKLHHQLVENSKKYSGKQLHFIKNDKLNVHEGLSLFHRNRAHTQVSGQIWKKQGKPFSAILSEYSKEKQRQKSIDQINEIKQRFAKYKINIQFKKIGDGMLPPLQVQAQELEKIGNYEVSLPNNKFFKVGKKKKKKKKKK